MTLQVRDLMPMFTVRNEVDGTVVRYRDLWQRKNLVLIALPQRDVTGAAYLKSVASLDWGSQDAALVVTTNDIAGISPPTVVVADRWGEVYYVGEAGDAADLPSSKDLLEWLHYVQVQCPECQGETR
jgi:hypothetical protein